MRRLYLLAAASLLAPLLTLPASAAEDCEEFVPESHSVTGVTDPGQNVNLDVLVLLDGIRLPAAKAMMTAAAQSYSPLKVTLRVTAYRPVRIPSDGKVIGRPARDVGRLMADTKAAVGGVRPKGTDTVLLLTDKVMTMVGPDGKPMTGIGGMADCIGGVRYPTRSFAVSVGASERTSVREAAITAAHELGHLLGAHHHYANCVEGGVPSLCTLMFNASLDFIGLGEVNSFKFGTVESAVVRGHAVDFAAP